MNSAKIRRPKTTPPELETREREWWEKFAALEDRFAWVQTPQIQTILRGNYLREIVRRTPAGGNILELGCGTGWLCVLLARLGATKVCGVDFSLSQIALAQKQAKTAGLSDRVQFHCADGTRGHASLGAPFDCVVVHAFLHHLDQVEIHRTLASIPKLLKPDGVFIVFEPIRHEQTPDSEVSLWQRWQQNLSSWSSRGRMSGWRRESADEAHWRALISHRYEGIAPHGPSPKEMPFESGELEAHLSGFFAIEEHRPCMAISHLVAQEWLLRGLSHPRSTKWLLPWVARIAAWMDRRLSTQRPPPAGLWIFTMFVCRPRVAAPPPSLTHASLR